MFQGLIFKWNTSAKRRIQERLFFDKSLPGLLKPLANWWAMTKSKERPPKLGSKVVASIWIGNKIIARQLSRGLYNPFLVIIPSLCLYGKRQLQPGEPRNRNLRKQHDVEAGRCWADQRIHSCTSRTPQLQRSAHWVNVEPVKRIMGKYFHN